MVEAGSWELLKTISHWVVYLILLPAGWILKKYVSRIEKLEDKVTELEKQQAVTNITLHNIDKNIEEIKHNVERLVDRS